MTVLNMDCVEGMKLFPGAYFDSIVTDPPYELGFMGKAWDASGIANSVEMWREALRVLKPGGHLLAFSGSRTYHRMVCAIEDAGFEIRDQIMWVYGSGFPKSLNVEKAIGETHGTSVRAATWQGWGTALKPAHEPIVVARKPLVGTVAANVLAYGTGAINVDGCRIPGAKPDTTRGASSKASSMVGTLGAQGRILDDGAGRWPANLIHDGSDEVLAAFPEAPGQLADASDSDTARPGQNVYGAMRRGSGGAAARVDSDKSAARFFYCAKASKADRSEVNTHPTVKPTELMRYLCRLVTPPGGLVLDPFAGSGSTGKACALEGFAFIGFELSAEYAAIATARISEARK